MADKETDNIWENTPIEDCFSEDGMAKINERIAAKLKYMTNRVYSEARKRPSRLKVTLNG